MKEERSRKRPLSDDDDDDDCVMDMESSVSLHCPMTLGRIRTAGRGIHCTHRACFDLETWVQLSNQDNVWYWPYLSLHVSMSRVFIYTYACVCLCVQSYVVVVAPSDNVTTCRQCPRCEKRLPMEEVRVDQEMQVWLMWDVIALGCATFAHMSLTSCQPFL